MVGFTIIELVVVMIIVGIMAFVAIPRMGDATFKEAGFHDAVLTTVAHARHSAIASRRYTCVTVTGGAGTVAVTRDITDPDTLVTVSCLTSVSLPSASSGCAANAICAPSGVTLNGGATTTLIFSPLGQLVTATKAVAGSAAAIGISNQASITVQPLTGYVQ